MPTPLPTVALTPSRLPPEGSRDWSHPFFSFDGYAEAGTQEAMVEIMNLAKETGLNALTVHELRIEYFRTQRAQRHGGGPYGEDDYHDRHMASVLAEVRRKVLARRGGLGIWEGDITTLDVDVIVNAANQALSGGGGVDGAIHSAAGPELLEATRAISGIISGVRCPVGDAVLTPGFALRAKHVAHAVGPIWKGGEKGEPEQLASAYRASLNLASGVGAESIAFPAISTGVYGYPHREAATVAVRTCLDWLDKTESDMRIILVAFGPESTTALYDAVQRVSRT